MLLAITNNTSYEKIITTKPNIYKKYKDILIYDTDDLSLEAHTKQNIKKAHKSGIIIENLKFYQIGSTEYFYEKEMPIGVHNLGHDVRVAFLGRYNAYQCGDWFHIGRYGGVITSIINSNEFFSIVSPPALENGEFVVKLYTIKAGCIVYKETRPIDDSGSVYVRRPNAMSQLLKGVVNCTCASEIENVIHTFLKLN